MGVPECGKISFPPSGKLTGAFVADNITSSKIDGFNQLSGDQLDMVLKFLSFSTGLAFPTAEAQIVADKNGAILIKLEPWSARGPKDNSFSLEKILAGKFDSQLKRFAEGAKAFGHPILVSFAHEMNGNWYPWSGNPELYVKAYRYVHDKISKEAGACNITWIWNPNIDFDLEQYYPGNDVVDVIMVDGYNNPQQTNGFWRSCQNLFSETINRVSTYGKPVYIGEFGSDAKRKSAEEDEKKAAWLSQCVNYVISQERIKGFVYFNLSKNEQEGRKSNFRNWAINTPKQSAAYKEAIQKYEAFFKNHIVTVQTIPSQPTPSSGKYPTALQSFLFSGSRLPAGFFRQSVNLFFLSFIRKVSLNNVNAGKAAKYLKMNLLAQKYGIENEADTWMKNKAEIQIMNWLNLRVLGAAGDTTQLDSAFKAGSISNFWKAILATVLLAEDSLAEEYLTAANFGIKTPFVPDSKEVELAILKEIYDIFITPKGDPKLQAENLTARALLSYAIGDKNGAEELAAQAKLKISELESPSKEKAIKAFIARRIPPSLKAIFARELYSYKIKAKLLRVKLLMLKVEDETDRKVIISILSEAIRLAKEATHGDKARSMGLEGFELLEVYSLAAECYIRRGFALKEILQPFRNDFKNASELLRAVVQWTEEYNRFNRNLPADNKVLGVQDEDWKPHPWVELLSGNAIEWLSKIPPLGGKDLERLIEKR